MKRLVIGHARSRKTKPSFPFYFRSEVFVFLEAGEKKERKEKKENEGLVLTLSIIYPDYFAY